MLIRPCTGPNALAETACAFTATPLQPGRPEPLQTDPEDEPAGRFWHIHVQDAGPGIPPEQMERLFLRFQRLPGDAQKPTGSGLGLAFVQTVARRHGGRAFCASTPGQGARFTISLPVDD